MKTALKSVAIICAMSASSAAFAQDDVTDEMIAQFIEVFEANGCAIKFEDGAAAFEEFGYDFRGLRDVAVVLRDQGHATIGEPDQTLFLSEEVCTPNG